MSTLEGTRQRPRQERSGAEHTCECTSGESSKVCFVVWRWYEQLVGAVSLLWLQNKETHRSPLIIRHELYGSVWEYTE